VTASSFPVLRSDTMRITVWVVRTISLKLPENLLVQLDAEAKTRRVTKSWLIRESLEKALLKLSGLAQPRATTSPATWPAQ